MNDTRKESLVTEPFPVPRRWGGDEITRLTEAMGQRSLFYWKGPQTEALYKAFREKYPIKHLFPCSSGTASIHVAVAALKFKPGDEVIVPSVTDMGSVIGLLLQQLVPVFVDIDPETYNMEPEAVEKAITEKTRAVMAVHLCGNPCDMEALTRITRDNKLVLIEDCAQAWGARYRGRMVGLMGDISCFSFNEFKHLSCGDGGMVGTQHDELGKHLSKWGDKCYNRVTGIRNPDELACNYRMSEALSAICTAQLGKHDSIIEPRVRNGRLLTDLLEEIPGITTQQVHPEDTNTYYGFIFRIEPWAFRISRDAFTEALCKEGVRAENGYIPQPVYGYDVFQNHNFFAGSWPIRDFGLTDMDYTQVCCPHAEQFLKDCIYLHFNEAMTEAYIRMLGNAIRTIASENHV